LLVLTRTFFVNKETLPESRQQWSFAFVRGGLTFVQGGLTFKFNKIPLTYNVSYFNLGGLKLCLGV